MIINRIKTFKDCWYPEDVKRLFKVSLENGMLIDAAQLEAIWESFSENRCAQWLTLNNYTDNQLLQVIETGDMDEES